MPPSISNSAFRLKWRRTWSDPQSSRDDFAASDGDGFCRIYRLVGGPHDSK